MSDIFQHLVQKGQNSDIPSKGRKEKVSNCKMGYTKNTKYGIILTERGN